MVTVVMFVLNAVETIFGSIARPEHSFLDDMLRNSLQIVSLSDVSHAFDEDRRQVDFPAEFGCAVVPWESMMVVVETCVQNLFPVNDRKRK